MGTSYTVFPITNEVIDWLRRKGIVHYIPQQDSRYPTPNEIRKVLNSLNDCHVEYTISSQTWRVTISDAANRWTSLVVLDYCGREGEEDIQHKFYFEKGWPELMERVLRGLSVFCGPFVLMSSSDLQPTLIFPETNALKDS